MRDAAVGFQCPTCVAEGAKSTRSGRTAYGGLRPGNAGSTSMVIIAINVAVWLAIVATRGASSRLVDYLVLRPNGLCAVPGQGGYEVPASACDRLHGTFLPGVADGAWWQPMTSAFTHVELLHIGFNMLALWVLGPQLELVLGRARFLALYLISALAGSALVMWASPEYQATLGASGAIFGLMAALLVVAVKARGNVVPILIWIAINAAFTITVPGVSWQGHLGGFVGGALIVAVLVYAPRNRRTLWQALGLGALTVALVASVLVRVAVLTA